MKKFKNLRTVTMLIVMMMCSFTDGNSQGLQEWTLVATTQSLKVQADLNNEALKSTAINGTLLMVDAEFRFEGRFSLRGRGGVALGKVQQKDVFEIENMFSFQGMLNYNFRDWSDDWNWYLGAGTHFDIGHIDYLLDDSVASGLDNAIAVAFEGGVERTFFENFTIMAHLGYNFFPKDNFDKKPGGDVHDNIWFAGLGAGWKFD